MATIQIHNLNGFDLLDDSESYLQELTDTELSMTNGGGTPTITIAITIVTLVTVVASYIFKSPAPPVGAGNDPIIHGINKRDAQFDANLP
jgi:hypothetical protein